jgi:hypothetical protein
LWAGRILRLDQANSSGGLISAFDCSFYHQDVYPFDLTPFITHDGAKFTENTLGPGYVIWTTDGKITGKWKDVLNLENNVVGASSRVSLSWPGGPAFPSLATVNQAGYLVLRWNKSGVQVFDPIDSHHKFTIYDNPPKKP